MHHYWYRHIIPSFIMFIIIVNMILTLRRDLDDLHLGFGVVLPVLVAVVMVEHALEAEDRRHNGGKETHH